MRRALTGLLLLAAARSASAQVDYHRAEQFLTWNATRLIYNDQVAPTWYADSTRFWYRVHTPAGFRFLSVAPSTGAKAQLFDNARLAAALSVAGDTAIQPTKLPFQTFTFDQDGKNERAILVRIGKRAFRCELAGYQCATTDTLPNRVRLVRSPDGQWDAFTAGNNLWVRPVAGGDSIQLTTDGAELYGYGHGAPRANQVRQKRPSRPNVIWSPDSKRLLVSRVDERGVGTLGLISMTSIRPVTYTYPYSMPGDSIVERLEWYAIDVGAKSSKRIDAAPQPAMAFYNFGAGGQPVQWTANGDRVFFTHVDRGPKRVRLMSADPTTGATRTLLSDSSSSYVIGSVDLFGQGTNWKVLKNGDLLWLSERDGFAHFYRYSSDGVLKNQITSGGWVVSALHWVDETAGRIYFSGKGRESDRHADYAQLYSVGVDGSGLTLLTPEKAHHAITPVPSGRYFIDTYSTVSDPPVVVIRGVDGRVVAELERANIDALRATGWRSGEVFVAKARDGVTDVWGTIWKPSHYDSTKRYPVIDHIYPGPLITPSPKAFFPNREAFTYPLAGQVQALAELGFIVVSIDAIGNTGRAKALNTLWYGNMGDNGIPDHVAVIKQLASRMPSMDLDRVGIYGHSGGAFASTGAMLRYPDFFKVAVSTAGNHDNRTYYSGWGERFQGLLVRDTLRNTDNFAASANKTLASNLKGKLFLLHGDLDDNVHPGGTIALVDALIKADKTFDFMVIPDADHGITQHPWVIRRTWDYFVQHLLGKTPPDNFSIAPPPT